MRFSSYEPRLSRMQTREAFIFLPILNDARVIFILAIFSCIYTAENQPILFFQFSFMHFKQKKSEVKTSPFIVIKFFCHSIGSAILYPSSRAAVNHSFFASFAFSIRASIVSAQVRHPGRSGKLAV